MDNMNTNAVPVVMSFAENDPSGGSGIQADIEALASMGCHCAPIITALTIQDSVGIKESSACSTSLLISQARVVLEDLPISVIKLGMFGNVENIEAIHSILQDYPEIPVVLDPVLSSIYEPQAYDPEIIDAIVSLILPNTTICIPSTDEAQALAPEADNLESSIQEIMTLGVSYVLLTGISNQAKTVINRLFSNHRELETFEWQRLNSQYHGAGYTLSASISGLLAQNLDPMSAVYEAQEYTWGTLQQGYRIGMGKQLPNRFFWARESGVNDEKGQEQ